MAVLARRGTRAALNTLAGQNGLLVGEILYLTDEQSMVIATATNAFEIVGGGKADTSRDFALKNHFGG